jgi:hypothetical protein
MRVPGAGHKGEVEVPKAGKAHWLDIRFRVCFISFFDAPTSFNEIHYVIGLELKYHTHSILESSS